jgi:hypothetical protein
VGAVVKVLKEAQQTKTTFNEHDDTVPMSQRNNSQRRSASNVSFGVFSGQQQQTQPRAATSTGRLKNKIKPQIKT